MNQKTIELISNWRDMGPGVWAGSSYGWITDEGKPIILEPWQGAICEAYNAHRATCSTLAISNVKKTGKTLLNAVITAHRWLTIPGTHFAIGNDLDQAASRVFSEVSEMVQRHPFLSGNVKVTGKELVFIPTGSTLTALAVDAAGNAGANHWTASHTEAWGVIYESGIRAWEELTPPPGKKHGLPALRIADSYAGYLGESKIWHDLVDRGLRGQRISEAWPIYQDGGLILFHMTGEEARVRCYRGGPEEAAEYYAEQARTLRANAYMRMHSNERTAGEAAFIAREQWEACFSAELRPIKPGERRRMILGADASTSHDLTALVGCIYNRETKLTEVLYSRLWKPVKIAGIRFGKPTIDLKETIGQEVLDLHKAGQVAAVVADPYQLMTLIIEWQRAGIKVIELAQNAGRVESDTALYTAITGRSIAHYNDPILTEHVINAVGVETPRGVRLAKEKSSLKIDAAVALSMAHWGAIAKQYTGAKVEVYDCDLAGGSDLYDPGWNKKPHPPGVTWQNCPHRNKGCYACYKEIEGDIKADEGYWNEYRKTHDPEQAYIDSVLNQMPMGPPGGAVIDTTKKYFWNNVKKRANE